MYYDFFGFREPPFSIAPDPRYLYLSARHKEALAHLMYGVEGQGGFIVITGEVGTGKTTVSRCFIENVPDTVDIALILNPRLSARELLSSICDELEISHPASATIKDLVDRINEDLLRAHAAGRHKVLIIDEAQNLSAEVLEQLRLLTNLETAEKKLLQIVLLGQPELQDMLALPELRQLNQRVTARYHLHAIGRREVPAYLRYRLSVAGVRGDMFSPRAINRLYLESQGIPRLINLISDRALLGAYAEGEHEITAGHIRHAAKEVRGHWSDSPSSRSSQSPDRSHYLLVAASILIAIVGTTWLYERWTSGVPVFTRASSAPPIPHAAETPAPQPPAQAGPSVSPEPPKPSAIDVPGQLLDSDDAYQVLFRIWGQDYSPTAGAACDWGRANGLGCLARRGSRRSLAFLDRPAMLRLQDGAGDQGFVVLRQLSGDTAEIALPSGNRTVSFASIEQYWFGEYQVLWRLPEYQTQSSAYNRERGAQLWLGARMMELADIHGESRSESDRVKRMDTEQQIRWYQAKRGLNVDGIAGPMTLIQINNDLENAMPRLQPPQSGGRE